ncbi:hypothetical protein JK192_15770 [Gluconobacter cerinus]|uniref:MAE_28990/MAE_18760 family HEPN-like nuclease n=1 Tax=Gluconobacter cerinus TaxID=38307 RepID=UPI001B8CDF6C|nr:hypothetical protein [Gluconobacter cerinus]
MIRDFVVDFTKRRRDLRRYVRALYIYERLSSKINDIDQKVNSAGLQLASEQLHVMRAGTFLVLYNMIEATSRNAIEAIHDSITSKEIRFEELNTTLQREAILGFKRRANPDQHLPIQNLSIEFVAAALDTDRQFNGNVDAKLLREISDTYGFSTECNKRETHNGSDLLTIKTARNDLAHGRKTYDEVGRNYSFRDILRICIRSTRYTNQIINNINLYLDYESYLNNPPYLVLKT